MTLSVRRAEPADAAEICAVLRASITELLTLEHRHDPATLGAWLECKTVENALRWINADDRYAVVATEAGTVCGFGMLKSTGEIGLLYVAPSARFRGVSKALLAALEERASAWGLKRMATLPAAQRIVVVGTSSQGRRAVSEVPPAGRCP